MVHAIQTILVAVLILAAITAVATRGGHSRRRTRRRRDRGVGYVADPANLMDDDAPSRSDD